MAATIAPPKGFVLDESLQQQPVSLPQGFVVDPTAEVATVPTKKERLKFKVRLRKGRLKLSFGFGDFDPDRAVSLEDFVYSDTPLHSMMPDPEKSSMEEMVNIGAYTDDDDAAMRNALVAQELYGVPVDVFLAGGDIFEDIYGDSMPNKRLTGRIQDDMEALRLFSEIPYGQMTDEQKTAIGLPTKPTSVGGRIVKGLVNKILIEPIRTILEKSNLGLVMQDMNVLASWQAEADKQGVDILSKDFKLSGSKRRQIREDARADVLGRAPLLEVTPPRNLAEKLLIDTPVGVTAFITKLALTKKFLGIPSGSTGGDVVAWEMVNLIDDGTPGTGAATALGLKAINSVPFVQTAQKFMPKSPKAAATAGRTLQLSSQGTFFAGVTKAQGGSDEDALVAFFLPFALATVGSSKNIVSENAAGAYIRARVPKAVADVFSARDLGKAWKVAKDSQKVKSGKMTREAWTAKHSKTVSDLFDKFGKVEGAKPTDITVIPPKQIGASPVTEALARMVNEVQVPGIDVPAVLPPAEGVIEPTPPAKVAKPEIPAPDKGRGVEAVGAKPAGGGKETAELKDKAKAAGNVSEFTAFVNSGTLAERQDRFAVITGGAIVDLKRGKLGIKGESVVREPFRPPTDQEIENFFFDAVGGKTQPTVKGAAFLPGTERTQEFDTVEIIRAKGKVTQVELSLKGEAVRVLPANSVVQAKAIKKEFDDILAQPPPEAKPEIPEVPAVLPAEAGKPPKLVDKPVSRDVEDAVLFQDVQPLTKGQKVAKTRKERAAIVEQETGVSTKHRNRLIKSQKEAILSSPGVQEIESELANDPRVILKGLVVGQKKISFGANFGDAQQYIDGVSGKGYLFKYVAGRDEPGRPWDDLAAEFALDTNTEQITDPVALLQMIDDAIRVTTETEGLPNASIDRAIQQGDLGVHLQRVAYTMLRKGFSLDEINDAIEQEAGDLRDGGAQIFARDFLLEPEELKPPKPGDLTDAQVKEAEKLRQQIAIEAKRKGLSDKKLKELRKEHVGAPSTTGGVSRAIWGGQKNAPASMLENLLTAVKGARPKTIGAKTVISRKTENQIQTLREVLTSKEQMNGQEFDLILAQEAGGKQPEYIDGQNFITQREGRSVIARMHDVGEKLRIIEPFRRAINKKSDVKEELRKIPRQPEGKRDPSRIRSMRYFVQGMEEKADIPLHAVYDSIILEHHRLRRNRRLVLDDLESMEGFVEIASSRDAMQRVSDFIASKSTLKNKPKKPAAITDNEIALAERIEDIFRSYETVARMGKFFEHIDDVTKIPQYLEFKPAIDRALDIYNSEGLDALTAYMQTQGWGIVRSGYEPIDSVIRKVSTHKMPAIAVGKSHIKVRGIEYSRSDRNILQRLQSYMRQMDALAVMQPKYKALVRMVDDSLDTYDDPDKVRGAIEIFLNNIKKMNYADGLAEEVMRKVYSQAITVRVLADPLKVVRNRFQNPAFNEDKIELLRLNSRELTPADMEYLETNVWQDRVMMSDWAFVDEEPFDLPVIGQHRLGIGKVTKWIQRKTLYPASDRKNRTESFHARSNKVRRAFDSPGDLNAHLDASGFRLMDNAQKRLALGILAKDGVDDFARYVARVHTDDTHFLYSREERSPAEQTQVGRFVFNLFLFRRAALEKAMRQAKKGISDPDPVVRKQAAYAFVTLIVSSIAMNWVWKKITGKKFGAYDFVDFLKFNAGGLELGAIQDIEAVWNDMTDVASGDIEALSRLSMTIPAAANMFIPFYDLSLRAVEATMGAENIDRVPLRKLRELIDKEYETRGIQRVDRDLIEKLQFTFANARPDEDTKPKRQRETFKGR